MDQRVITPPAQQPDIPENGSHKAAGGVRRVLGAFWSHRWFILVAVIAAAIGVWQVARILIGPAIAVDIVQRGDLVQTVVASGHVETPYRVEIGSQITGTVNEVLVEEGLTVAKGQPLIVLDSSELKAALVQAQGALAQAEARQRQMKELTLPSAKEALVQAQAVLLNAQQIYDRAAQLLSRGAQTRVAVDEAKKALDVARTQVRSAELQVFTASPGGSDAVMVETQLAQAHANLDSASSRLAYATIAAPRDGVLISRTVERGTVVQPGKALMVLAPAGETQLVIQLDERNLGLIRLGQPAVASADAYPDERMQAKVVYINPGVDITRASVEVKLGVPEPPLYLRQDMTVSVDIETARRDGTLIVPARDVHDGNTASPWVLGLRDGRAVKRPVKLGLRGQGSVEVIDGLGMGDAVVPIGSGVVTGKKIRAIRP
ncbi:efflux RND transporter periplasmic adaptor subunit [Bosea sp. AS-1]|uniref:efflux RND transporter periplasmic adaptor subunit n=1 Tax=Bosea sp. AS-1 TaxID=2015316 RepID=UPI000B782682|nr:efflux RND transporter periplasmic adaptor subunit [Bosea sp. AS-1]